MFKRIQEIETGARIANTHAVDPGRFNWQIAFGKPKLEFCLVMAANLVSNLH